MSATILTILAALFIGGLALLAQYARKNRSAEISLIITLLASSALILVIGIFVCIGLVLASRNEALPQQAVLIGAGAAAALGGLVGTSLYTWALVRILRRPKASAVQAPQNPGDPWETSTGPDGGASVVPARSFWTDPPILFAVWLFALVMANNIASILAFAIAPQRTGDLLAQSGQVTFGTVATSQIPFVIVAAAGVGLFVTRDWRGALARLGFGAISIKQVGVVVLFIVGAVAASIGADRLFAALQPDLYQTVGKLSETMFGSQGMSPVSAILFALLIGLGAGLGEESLFRGAVQPKLGIVLTSVLFASMHVQYGLSILLIFIFLLAVGLGLLRRHINTTAAFLAHAGYNASGVLLAYFFGV